MSIANLLFDNYIILLMRATFDLPSDELDKLRRIAAMHGCAIVYGPKHGQGSVQQLVDGIVAGRLLVVANPAYQPEPQRDNGTGQ